MDEDQFKQFVRSVTLGKRLPDSIYLHKSLIDELPEQLVGLVRAVANALKIQDEDWDVLKLFKGQYRLSFLSYPGFFEESYPELSRSTNVDLVKLSQRVTNYDSHENPPILHRKETMLGSDHPRYQEYLNNTLDGERIGLYENTRIIGFKEGWLSVIRSKGFKLVDGKLLPSDNVEEFESDDRSSSAIDRYKTAIVRHELSSPMKLLAKNGYLNGDYSIFDFGCGRGDDLTELQAHGINAVGWDPVHRPDEDKIEADIVNLGFVLNVIEDTTERAEALLDAWGLTNKILVVSVMLGTEAIISQFRPYKDGVITSRNTFQKYYAQSEIKAYIERTLDEMPVTLGPGIFAIFKDKGEEQRFLSARYHRNYEWKQLTSPSSPDRDEKERLLITQYPEIFSRFWNCCLQLARLPTDGEFDELSVIKDLIGSPKRALNALIDLNSEALWEEAKWRRKEDLILYFAMGLFEKRRPYTSLDDGLKRDVKALFSDYKTATNLARDMLFLIADSEAVEEACEEASKTLPASYLREGHSLELHRSYLAELPLLLRLYVGSGLQMYGDVDEVDLVKIHITSGKLTLMVFDDFNKSVPFLVERVKIKMAEQDIDFFDYIDETRRPPLLQKHRYLAKGTELYSKQRSFDKRLEKIIGTVDDEHMQRIQFNEALSGYKIANYTIRSI